MRSGREGGTPDAGGKRWEVGCGGEKAELCHLGAGIAAVRIKRCTSRVASRRHRAGVALGQGCHLDADRAAHALRATPLQAAQTGHGLLGAGQVHLCTAGKKLPSARAMSCDSCCCPFRKMCGLSQQRMGVRWVGVADKGRIIIHAFQRIHPSCPSRSRNWGEAPGCWLPPSRPCRAGLACWAAAAASWGPLSAASWGRIRLMAHMI